MTKQLSNQKPKNPNKEKRKKNPTIPLKKSEARRSQKRENPKAGPRSKSPGVAFSSERAGRNRVTEKGVFAALDQVLKTKGRQIKVVGKLSDPEQLEAQMRRNGITKDQTFHDAPTFDRSWYHEELRVVKQFVAAMKTITPEALVTLLFRELKAEMGPEQFDFLPQDKNEQNKKYWEKINSTQTKP